MAAGRSIWNGSIAFGLVVVPVKLYTATEEHDIQFRQVHREDGGRIQFKRFCSADGTEVPYADIAKGYEMPDGNVVVLTDDDMRELPLPTAKTIEVLKFIDPAQVDPLMYSKSYYVTPDGPAAGTAFTLLTTAMHQEERAGLIRVALRQRESLGLLTERGGSLVLTLLRWPDEVREVPKPAEPAANLSEALIGQAAMLVATMAGDFVPAEHTDRYTEAVAALVASKVSGAAMVAPTKPADGAPMGLGDALAASVAAAKGARTNKKKGGAKVKTA